MHVVLRLLFILAESNGTLPEIDYDRVDECLRMEGAVDMRQDYVFPGCWKSGHRTAYAIKEGLRGEELIPALTYDARAWMFMRPDM